MLMYHSGTFYGLRRMSVAEVPELVKLMGV